MRNRLIYWIDLSLLLAAALFGTVPATGFFLREWLAVLATALILRHELLPWNWITLSFQRLLESGTWS